MSCNIETKLNLIATNTAATNNNNDDAPATTSLLSASNTSNNKLGVTTSSNNSIKKLRKISRDELLKDHSFYALDPIYRSKQLKKQRRHDIQKLCTDGGGTNIKNKHSLTMQKLDVDTNNKKLNRTNTKNENSKCHFTFIFDPNGRFSYWMSFIVSLAFLYNFWVIIYRFSFNEINSKNKIYWFIFDYFTDLLYILDIVFNFRTGFLEEGVLQTHPGRIRHYYMNTTRFYVDCLCLMPLDILYISFGFSSILRCFRLIKIYRFWAFLDRTERHTNYPNIFRSLVMLHYLFAIFHWNACFYHKIAPYLHYNNITEQQNSNSIEHIQQPPSKLNDDQYSKLNISDNTLTTTTTTTDITMNYLKAFYWSTMVMTLIGETRKPTNKAEYLFLSIELIFALLLFAAIMGHVAYIVANLGNARKEFQSKLDAVKTYMIIRRVPIHLQDRVIRWFDFLWMNHKSTDDNQILNLLPYKLRAEIAIHVHLDTLKRVEIFQNTEAGFLNELVLRLKPVLYSPGDYICRKGEVGKEMYIVNRGKLHVTSDNNKSVLATLKAGSYFGEISVLNMGASGNRRTASVKSVGYSDLFCLSKQDLWEVLKEYPAVRVKLEVIAIKRLEKHKKTLYEEVNMSRCKSTPGLIEPSHLSKLDTFVNIKRHSTLPNAFLLTTKTTEKTLINVTTNNLNVNEVNKTKSRSNEDIALRNISEEPTNQVKQQYALLNSINETENKLVKRIQNSSSITTSPSQDSSDHRASNFVRYNNNNNNNNNNNKNESLIDDDKMISKNVELLINEDEIRKTDNNNSGNSIEPKAVFIQEIQTLRKRLSTIETENTYLTLKLKQQHAELKNRISDIELQLNNRDSFDSDLLNSDDLNV